MEAYIILFTLSIVQIHASFNLSFGSIALQAKIGTLPKRYLMTSNDDVATKTAVHIVNEMRKSMDSGVGLVPVLDPYEKVDLKPMNFGNNAIFKGNVHLKNLRVAGAKNFTLISTRLYIKNHRAEFNIAVPNVVINVDFKAQATFSFVPITFSGHLRANLLDVNIYGAIGADQTVINGKEIFQLVSAAVFIKARNLNVQIEGVTKATRSLLNNIWSQKKKDIALFGLEQVLKEVNSILKHFTVETVLSCLNSNYTCLMFYFVFYSVGYLYLYRNTYRYLEIKYLKEYW